MASSGKNQGIQVLDEFVTEAIPSPTGTPAKRKRVSVFVLQHVHAAGGGAEDVKFIGVYSSREKANAAVARLSTLPGFAEPPHGFHIDEYVIDTDQWIEGYAPATSVSLTR